MQIDRLPIVTGRTGFPKPSIYSEIKKGTFPPSIKIYGSRAAGWLRDEYEAVMRARIAGKTDDDIKQLVKELVRKRAA